MPAIVFDQLSCKMKAENEQSMLLLLTTLLTFRLVIHFMQIKIKMPIRQVKALTSSLLHTTLKEQCSLTYHADCLCLSLVIYFYCKDKINNVAVSVKQNVSRKSQGCITEQPRLHTLIALNPWCPRCFHRGCLHLQIFHHSRYYTINACKECSRLVVTA